LFVATVRGKNGVLSYWVRHRNTLLSWRSTLLDINPKSRPDFTYPTLELLISREHFGIRREVMSDMRELTDTEVDAVCGGGHHHHHHPHYGGGFTLLKPDFSNGVLQNNITVQIALALFGGSVSQISNSTNLSII
jgi:hypothetical protein